MEGGGGPPESELQDQFSNHAALRGDKIPGGERIGKRRGDAPSDEGQASILLGADAAGQAYFRILAQAMRAAAQLAAHMSRLRAPLDVISSAGASARGVRGGHESIRGGEPRILRPHLAAPKDRIPSAGADTFDVHGQVGWLGRRGPYAARWSIQPGEQVIEAPPAHRRVGSNRVRIWVK